jgi:short subunit dehydrogenase-like uncharacterized protein
MASRKSGEFLRKNLAVIPLSGYKQAGHLVSETLATSEREFQLAPREIERLETLLEELSPSAQAMLELKRE